MKNKIVIIGCGKVGMSYAYALLNQKTKVSEIVLIDIDEERVKGEAMDLNHGLPFAPSKINIKAGTYTDCTNATIVCLCAGVTQKKGEERLNLAKRNEEITKEIVDKVLTTNFHGIFLIATNPVDVITYVVQKYSKFPEGKVIGTGTTLDTARLRYTIGDYLTVNPKNVHVYVLGEHGDSEFVAWSNAFVGSGPMLEYISEEKQKEFEREVKKMAYDIIERKGATYYGIGMSLVRITNAILNNENTVLTVSSYSKNYGLYIGTPSVVNQRGVVSINKMVLNDEEIQKYKKSINIIKEEIKKIGG